MPAGRSSPVRRRVLLALIVLAAVVAAVLVVQTVDATALRRGVSAMAADPTGLAVALAAFGGAFGVRAALWTRVLPSLRLRDALSAIHVALAANHLLPFRLGEGARVVVARRRSGLPLGVLTSSTVALRLADMVGLALVAAAVAPGATLDLVGWLGVAAVVVAVVGAALASLVLVRQAATADLAVRLDPLVLLGAAGAWVLEAVLVHRVATWTGLEPTWSAAIFVATVSVAAQVVAIAPGGFGTYEAAATAAWVATGVDAEVALAAALSTHAFKTVWSLAVGIVGVVLPRPSLVGPLRLPRRCRRQPVGGPADPGPIVVFFPAFDEERTVASVIDRVPAEVADRPVVTMVIDDGSTDDTAARARAAGAVVVAHDRNRGLGAAVRTGLAEAVDRDAAVVVFADADGEYPPEQLDRLVAPILDGTADVVHGSRFAGGERRMHPHRWVGNRLLTAITRWIARTPMTDAQTGYRAYSRAAAAAADVIHDYNYAQVLTLDLLGKGFVLGEVPIDYAFRTEGRSFVRLPTYLRCVAPAVLREVRSAHTDERRQLVSNHNRL